MSYSVFWVVLGLAGQAMFSLRFLVQWICSERARQSVVPVTFWYLSLLGGGTLLLYAIHRVDPVFIIGQSVGFSIYGRNLYLIHAERTRTKGARTGFHGESAPIEKRDLPS